MFQAEGAGEGAVKKYEIINKEYLKWTQADIEARSYIVSAVPDCLLIKTIRCIATKELWKVIRIKYESRTRILRTKITCQIYNEYCTEPNDVRTYIATMVRLWEKPWNGRRTPRL